MCFVLKRRLSLKNYKKYSKVHYEKCTSSKFSPTPLYKCMLIFGWMEMIILLINISHLVHSPQWILMYYLCTKAGIIMYYMYTLVLLFTLSVPFLHQREAKKVCLLFRHKKKVVRLAMKTYICTNKVFLYKAGTMLALCMVYRSKAIC